MNELPPDEPERREVSCYICGERIPADFAEGMDLSDDDEYYPDMVPVCPSHGDSNE